MTYTGRSGSVYPSPDDLMKVALRYLERFSASRDSVRRVLQRRVARAATAESIDGDGATLMIAAVLDRLTGLGYLDDASFAEARARSLTARGASSRVIRARLRQKGVAAEVVEQALFRVGLDRIDEEGVGPDLAAAVALARRRRFGPWGNPQDRAARRNRELAALARRGFGADVAHRVLDAEDPGEMEALVMPL